MTAYIDLALGVIALAGAAAGWWRWARPRTQRKAEERAAINEVLLGRAAVPANAITGAPAVAAKPSIGQLVADIHHELHPNSGESVADKVTRADQATARLITEVGIVNRRLAAGDERFGLHDDRLARIEQLLRVELQTIQDAIHAEPPPPH